MKEVAGPLVSEAAKYGIGIAAMSVIIFILSVIITVMWKHIVKQEEKIESLMRESIEAMNELKNAINQLSLKL